MEKSKEAVTLSVDAIDCARRIERRIELTLDNHGIKCEMSSIKLPELIQIYLDRAFVEGQKHAE